MTRFVMVTPLLVIIVLLAGAASAASTASAQSLGCGNGVAVARPSSNPGLVADCDVLLAARDTLAGTGTLNWSATTPIGDWYDVKVYGTPQRVTGLSLEYKGFTGTIPSSLGNLTNLRGVVKVRV